MIINLKEEERIDDLHRKGYQIIQNKKRVWGHVTVNGSDNRKCKAFSRNTYGNFYSFYIGLRISVFYCFRFRVLDFIRCRRHISVYMLLQNLLDYFSVFRNIRKITFIYQFLYHYKDLRGYITLFHLIMSVKYTTSTNFLFIILHHRAIFYIKISVLL